MPFADLYPLESFAVVADASWWRASELEGYGDTPAGTHDQKRAARELDSADQARLKLHDDKIFQPALRAHLEALRSEGRLAPTGGLAGRDVWSATAWNAFVANEPEDHHTIWLINALAKNVFTRAFVRMDDMRRGDDREPGVHVPPTDEKVRAAWAKICADLDGGTSRDQHMGWAIEAQDAETGDRCEMTFENWKGVLMRRNDEHRLEPAEDVGELPLVAVGIDVPSGRLLLTDTLRVEGFKEGTDFGREDYSALSLGSEKGCLERTRVHAARHDLAFRQTINTSVNVFRHDETGDIAFIEARSKTLKGWTEVGMISCDIWRITALDRDTAIRLMTNGGNADAQTDLDRYLALGEAEPVWTGAEVWADVAQAHHEQCYSKNVVRLDVTPGRWTFHSGPDFAKRADKKALGLPRTAKPWAVLQAPRAA